MTCWNKRESTWTTNKRRSKMRQIWLSQRIQITAGLKYMPRSSTSLEGGSRIWICSLSMSVSSRRIVWSLSMKIASLPHDCPKNKKKKIRANRNCQSPRKFSHRRSMISTLDTTLAELVIKRLRSLVGTKSVQSSSSRRPYPVKWVLKSLAFYLRLTTDLSKIRIKK